jgi:hypothetical protein
LYQDFVTTGDWEVHSSGSLQESRVHSVRLLAALPAHQRTEMAVKCVDQELKLQESIRLEDFATHDMSTKLRRVLTWFFALTTAFFLLIFIGFVVAQAVFKLQIDGTLFDRVEHVFEVTLAGGLLSVLRFFFVQGKPKPKDKPRR